MVFGGSKLWRKSDLNKMSGKVGCFVSKKENLRRKIIVGLTTASVLCSSYGTNITYANVADTALPTGGSVAYGDATISQDVDTSVMNIAQTSDKAIIDWQSFNVGRDATVNYIQTLDGKPNTAAMTLNRVDAAGGLSEIAGNINSIGSFILVNPNGTVFYDGSNVNAAGVVVSTAEIDENAFKNNKLVFAQNKDNNNNIIVNGTINAATNGAYLTGANGMLAKVIKNVDESVLNTTDVQLATGFSFANNTIRLVADGDIAVGQNGALQATTTTTIDGDKTVGAEEFSVEGDSSTREGSIVLRADQNADDVANIDANVLATAGINDADITVYDKSSRGVEGSFKTAKVYLNNADRSQIASQNVSVYYDADITEAGINGTEVSSLGLSNTAKNVFTQKDYSKYSAEAGNLKSKVAQTFDGGNIKNQNYSMLVNDIYQLEAIQDAAFGNMGGSYAQGTSFSAFDTANWNDGAGFVPVGSELKPFTGYFSGNGGSATYKILDLHINRPDEDNVGLFGFASGAGFGAVNVVDSLIVGRNHVGGIAGQAVNHSRFGSDNVRKRVKESDGQTTITTSENNITGQENVGGIVGKMTDGSIRYSASGATVAGNNNVGGLAGEITGEAAGEKYGEGYYANIYFSNNKGYYSANETAEQGYGVVKGTGINTGGLVGSLNSTAEISVTESASNGQVYGKDNVGGLTGQLAGGKILYSYNTNEDTILGKSSIVTAASVGDGTSIYGEVNGVNNVGGIVGKMTDGIIEQSYNAGNVAGDVNVGGVAGNLSGGTIEKAYNADNNTVLYTSTNDKAYYGFKDNVGNSYIYNQADQSWLKTDSNEISSEIALNDLPAENQRTYYNRLAYRDAVVKGQKNVGGVVGTMSGGAINQVYTAGKVKATGVENIGAYVGEYINGTISDSFYVTRQNDDTDISGQSKAVGNNIVVDGIKDKTLYEAQNTTDTNWTGMKNTGNGWTIYNYSSTPLLNHFMRWININRQYEYDGTVHNLMTTDVNNYYGGAFFGNGDGKNVYSTNYDVIGSYNAADWVIKSGSGSADTSHSSVYRYDKSTMWSPQHGYYTSDDARMIITPKNVEVTVTGAKTYGNNAVSGAEYASDAVKDSGKYAVEATGFIGDDTSDSVFDVDLSVTRYASDSNQLAAGTYEKTADFINPEFNRKNNNYNYNVTFKDKLTVDKADLYVNLVGEKVYGDAVKNGTYRYYAVDKNTVDAGKTISDNDVQNDGKLKSWDTIPTSEADAKKFVGTVTSLTADSDVKHNNQSTGSNEINAKSDVIGHYDADGKFVRDAYNLADAQITSSTTLEKNYNVIYDTAKGSTGKVTVTPKDAVVKVVGEKVYGADKLVGGEIGATATTAGEKGKYSVTVTGLTTGDTSDAVFDVDMSSVSCEEDSNQLGAGKYTDANAHFTNPLVTNKNFIESDQINHNYNAKVTNELNVKKADLYVNIVGTKKYGDNIQSGTYSYYATNKNNAAAGSISELDKLNNGSLKSWDSFSTSREDATMLDGKNINSLTATEDVYANTAKQADNKIGAKSNVVGTGSGSSFTVGHYDLAAADLKPGTFNTAAVSKNYNIIFDHTKGSQGEVTVTPSEVIATVTATKTYGEAAVQGNDYAVSVKGFVNGDSVESVFDIDKSATKYKKDSSKLAVGTYDDVNEFVNPKFTGKDNNHNYTVKFVDKLTVKSAPTPVPSFTSDPVVEPEPVVEPVLESEPVPAVQKAEGIPDIVEYEVNKASNEHVPEEQSEEISYGGHIAKEGKESIRYITIEDTGINIENAKAENNIIKVSSDSLVDGMNEVIISGNK